MIACLRPLSALILAGLLTACATSSNSGLGRTSPYAECQHRAVVATGQPEQARGSGAAAPLGSGPCLPAEGPRQVHRHPGTDSAGKPEAGPAGLRQHPERRTGPRPQQAQGRPAGIAASEHAASQRTAGDPAGSYPARQGPGPRRRRPGPCRSQGAHLLRTAARGPGGDREPGKDLDPGQQPAGRPVATERQRRRPQRLADPGTHHQDLADPAATAGQHRELATAEPRAPGGQALAGGAGETQDAVPAAADPHRPPATPAGAVGQRRPGPAGRLPRRPLPGPAGQPESSFDQALRQYPGALAR